MATKHGFVAVRSWPARIAGVRRSTWMFFAAAVLGSVLAVYLRSRVPFTLGVPSPLDALLFVRQATALSEGHWLGPFNNVILAKGPAYPAFVAASYHAHVSLPIADQFVCLAAAASIAACAWVVTRRPGITTVLYLVVALDPSNFSSYHAQVTRDGWYQSVSLIFISFCFLAVHAAITGARLRFVFGLSLLAGLAGGVFWLCREEGTWILGAVAVLVLGWPLAHVIRRYRRRPPAGSSGPPPPPAFRRLAMCGLTLALAFVIPVAVVAQVNQHEYGVALTNDLTTGEFARAYAQWSRVQAGLALPDVPVSQAQREAVYRISPAAREMEPFMESARNPWLLLSCGQPVRADCDIGGAYLAWSMRDAAFAAGHFRTESAAQSFFAQVADDIARGCSDRALRCDADLPTALQPLARASVTDLLAAMGQITANTFWSYNFYALPAAVRTLTPSVQARSAAVIRGFPDPSAATRQMRSFRAQLWPYRTLALLYDLALPVLIVVAALGLAFEVAVRRRMMPATLLCAALLIGVASRIFVFSLITVTQYPARQARYQLPSHVFVLAFAVLGSYLAAHRLRPLIRMSRPPA